MTLIEVVLVLLLIGIMTAVALPRVSHIRDALAVQESTSEAESILLRARHLAMTRTLRASVTIDTVAGVLVLTTDDGIRIDTILNRAVSELHQVTLSANRSRVTYLPSGAALGGSNLTLIATREDAADTLTVSRLGRVKR